MKGSKVFTENGSFLFIDPTVIYQVANGLPIHAMARDESTQEYTVETFIPFEAIDSVEVYLTASPAAPVDANCN